ncbi:hypothetical protein ACQKCJ_08770 [Flavobacterium sp. NPDC079362]|uniref:hypothetical protein n=1 Tax=Flavobacterium sp. NPDC079362 TaxID=3390566 RepID=UPI003D018B83
MKIRNISRSSIQYIVIQSDFSIKDPINFSADKKNNIFHYLQRFPRDFIQLEDQQKYFTLSENHTLLNPALSILIFEEKGFKSRINPIIGYSKILDLDYRVVVYIVDVNCKNKDNIIASIKSTNQKYFYFCFFGEPTSPLEISLEKDHYFESLAHLLASFKRDFPGIKQMFAQKSPSYKNLTLNLDENENASSVLDFNPLIPNFLILMQTLNKFWKVKYPENRENIPAERSHALYKIITEIDQVHKNLRQNQNAPILIATFPFFNPAIKSYLKNKESEQLHKLFTGFYGMEQNLEYRHEGETKTENINTEQKIAELVLEELVKPKLLFLDAIAYLQSSFTFSPIFRAPLIGYSIYRELSMFNPANANFQTQNSLRNIFKSLLKLGEKLSNHTLSEELKNYIKEREGQLLVISDLPIEWLTIDSVPLCFSHDICRIPEANYQGILNNYSANNRLNLVVTDDVLSKTLIILSGDAKNNLDHEFNNSYKMITDNAEKLGYKYVYCNSIKEIAVAVRKYQPTILVFDCHGNIDANSKETFLTIGNQRLTGREISKHKISAPIVFLSCCNTSPNYGYVNQIHDAFFEVGAITVTGTFLPISIKRGTAYYIRILYLLQQQSTKRFYDNWLSFISNSIRTSLIHDVIIKASDKLGRSLTEDEINFLSELINDIQIFSKRREIFLKLISIGIDIGENLNIKIQDTDCEFLMYTHYGRPDLITFETANS